MSRLRELDFLRGVAIILVLFRHADFVNCITTMGWIGVDLFFVLSGFLVSGLLFREYLKFGNIQPKQFLIRRGFKIYPIYYLFYIPYLIIIINQEELNIIGFLADMTFTQNYVLDWGYAYYASWSLAVEEHFYVLFSLFLWLGLKYNGITLKKIKNAKGSMGSFETIVILTMVFCLLLRFYNNVTIPTESSKNFTMTHLRIDSLLAGVLIAYLYYFRINYLTKTFHSYKYLLLSIAILGLSWTPFIEPIGSFFAMTLGFSYIYISFGILLIYFLLTTDINQKLNNLFSSPIINIISKIGYCSYSIYIIHSFIYIQVHHIISKYHLFNNNYFNFLIISILSIIVGMFMTYKIENYFLRIRDKHFPNRERVH